MGETTQRTVETRYTARDAGFGSAMTSIQSTFGGAARKADEFRVKLGEMRAEAGYSTLGMLGLGVGLVGMFEKAREAQTEFADTSKSLAGVLSASLSFAKGTTEIDRYNRSLTLSRDITEQLEQTGARFNTGLGDLASGYKTAVVAAGALGLSQKQVMDLTVEATATAKRFGVSGEQAATSIARAIQTGTVRGFDPFDLKLRQVLGNMHKLNQAQRFEHVQKALRGSMEVADAMSQGIGANINRAQVAVTSLFREATGPLFKEIGDSISGWSKHIRELRENGRPVVEMFGTKLVDAFKTLREITAFLKDHWVVIGATFAGIKAGGVLESLAGNLGGLAGALGKSSLMAGSGIAGGVGGLGSLAGTLGALAPALGGIVTAAGLAAIALHGVYDEWQSRKKQAADLGGFFTEMGKVAQTTQYMRKHQNELSPAEVESGKAFAAAHAAAAAEILKSKGLYADGAIALEKFNGVMDSMADDVRDSFTRSLGLSGMGGVSSGMLGAAASEMLAKNIVAAQAVQVAATSDKSVKFAKQVNNFNGGIHITQKFEDQDPDAVFIRFRDDLTREVGSRTQALTAEPQGD